MACFVLPGCGIGYVVYRVRTTDDVVLVKGTQGEPNILYPRFVRHKFAIRKAPQSLLDRNTGVLNRWNKKVKSGEVVVFSNYQAAKESGETFEEDVTLTDLFKQRKKRRWKFWQRMRRREKEDRETAGIPREISWRE